MSLTLDDLFVSPDHHLFMFEGEHAVFLPMDRAAYHRSIFLDDRIDPVSEGEMKVPLDMLTGHPGAGDPPAIGWIFHVAHCGSTLLARGLDRPGESLVLREPLPLRQLAVEGAQAFAGKPVSPPWREGLRLAMAMAGKRYEPAKPVVVKANVPVNFIIAEIMTLTPQARAVLLHFGFADYLAAILRSPDHRQWLRWVSEELKPAIEAEAGAIDGLDDAGLAAALWLAQMRLYVRALERWPHLRSLDAEQLLSDPGPAIAAAADYFGIAGADDGALAGLTGTYAKNPGVAFDNEARLERRRLALETSGAEIAAARGWLETRLADYPLPERLAYPLIGEGARLFG